MKLRKGDPWTTPDAYGRTLTGLSLNLIVQDVSRSLPFYCDVLGLAVIYHDPDFAAIEGHGAKIMLHADHTYETLPAGKGLGAGRGRGVEFRLLGIDPDAAASRAQASGYDVAHPPENFPHGWRECHLRDPDGYLFAVGVPS